MDITTSLSHPQYINCLTYNDYLTAMSSLNGDTTQITDSQQLHDGVACEDLINIQGASCTTVSRAACTLSALVYITFVQFAVVCNKFLVLCHDKITNRLQFYNLYKSAFISRGHMLLP